MSKIIKYTVIRDQQEKENAWEFEASRHCLGTVEQHLKTADYTLEGFESIFCVEKKSSTGEISKNVYDPAFERELERMEAFAYPYVVCEFTMDDVCRFPLDSGIPKYIWPRLCVTSHGLLKRILELSMQYKAKFIFAGNSGHQVARSLFKRVIELEQV